MMTNPSQSLCRDVSEDELAVYLQELDIYGFSVVKNFLNDETVKFLLNTIEKKYSELNQKGRISYGGAPSRDALDKIIYSIHNYDKVFLDLLVSPLIRSVGIAKLNDPYYRFLPPELPNYTLQYFNARSSGLALDLHIDSHIPYISDHLINMQFVFFLEDSTIDNGCTVVVPGSHKSGKYTDRNLKNVNPIQARAGDLVFWDSRIWHGTLENKLNQSRWALVATLGQWWIKPALDLIRGINPSVYGACSDEQKLLLGFCSVPPVNEFVRNNTKNGYDFLKAKLTDYDF